VLFLLIELTSNTATAAAFLPVTGAVAVGAAVEPLVMSLTVAMTITCVFMRPVATPSTGVGYATGELEMRHIIPGGIRLHITGAVITIGMLYTVAPMVLGRITV
jgi:solute carrier family 13 (sodium-dependent dicarboxylate transporter), member 2/3/5